MTHSHTYRRNKRGTPFCFSYNLVAWNKSNELISVNVADIECFETYIIHEKFGKRYEPEYRIKDDIVTMRIDPWFAPETGGYRVVVKGRFQCGAFLVNPYAFSIVENIEDECMRRHPMKRVHIAVNIGTKCFCCCKCCSEPNPEPEKRTILYGYIVNEIHFYSEITREMLDDAGNHIVSMDAGKLSKTSLGVLDAGYKVLVLIPEEDSYVATKDNGIGGKVAFDESIMGTNGELITLGTGANAVRYRMYGEFMATGGELFIYID